MVNRLGALLPVALVVSLFLAPIRAAEESDYYRIVPLELPEGLVVEPGGLTTLEDGRLAIATRRGEIWIVDNPDAPGGKNLRFHKFAEALHEPLGLMQRGEWLYVMQRSELTRIRDADGDGTADEYLTVAKGWGVSGNYHEYAYGPEADGEGNLWITLNIPIGERPWPDRFAWRGWGMVVTPGGELVPMCTGMRSPAGLGANLAGDMFYSDQQGNWFGTGPIFHLRRGAFYGHPDGLASAGLPGSPIAKPESIPSGLLLPDAVARVEGLTLPAVWLPYRKMGMSATDILCDTTEGGFGPFAGQLFVGDFTMSMVTRVALEKVGGEYQGACFPFRAGFDCAVVRLAWTPGNSLIAGETNRGWNSLGSRSYGLERLEWTGVVPFEILEMRARSDGFVLTFTKPADRRALADPDSYSIESYTYEYHAAYGSDEMDKRSLTIGSAEPGADGRSVRLRIEGLREAYVHELHAEGVRSADGEALLHPEAYYTLNRIPGRQASEKRGDRGE